MQQKDPFVWTEAMSVGVRELDAQHQHLFALLNSTAAALRDGRPREEILTALDEIANYNVYHLAAEESYMEEFECRSEAHLDAHRLYRQLSRELWEKAVEATRSGSASCREHCEKLINFSGHWHIQHISTVDTSYTACFNAHGLL